MDHPSDQRVSRLPESVRVWRPSNDERPVFVDDSGRRARAVCAGGVALASLAGLWLVSLTVGIVGFSGFPVHLPPLPRVGPVNAVVARADAVVARADAVVARADAVADQAEIARRRAVYAVDNRSREDCPSYRSSLDGSIPAGTRTRTPNVRKSDAPPPPTAVKVGAPSVCPSEATAGRKLRLA